MSGPFGHTLYLWRRARGLTQAELARRARIVRPNLSDMERGKREVTLGTLRALALGLGIRPGLLVDGVPPGAEGRPAPPARETLERIADAVVHGRAVASPVEQAAVEALQRVVWPRLRALRNRPGCPRRGSRQADAAWVWLRANYAAEALRSLVDRITNRHGLR